MTGHFIAAGLVPLSLSDLAKAVKEAGAEDAAGEDGEEMDPALIDNEKALPMLLVAANAIKVGGMSPRFCRRVEFYQVIGGASISSWVWCDLFSSRSFPVLLL
jgi:hypothetical protein